MTDAEVDDVIARLVDEYGAAAEDGAPESDLDVFLSLAKRLRLAESASAAPPFFPADDDD